MTSIYDESVPGTTLKNLIEQNAFLSEFANMMRRRFDLDKQYTDSLRELRASANPKWADSAAQPVISPFLTLIDKEIELRENTTNTLFTTLDELPPSHSPDEPDEKGITPITKYKELQISYEEYLLRYREVNTKEYIDSLQAWYRNPRVEQEVRFLSVNEIDAYIFPEVDRKYRESVVNQHRESQRVSEWHKSYLPRCLDTHQQRVEDIKLILDSVTMDYSRLASQLVQEFAVMADAVSNISSSKYIAPLHVSQEPEMEHVSIQPVVYRNFYTDGEAAHPVFGLPLSKDYLSSILSYYGWYTWIPLSIEAMFKLEETASNRSSIQELIYHTSRGTDRSCIVASFLTIPPLMHLPAGLIIKSWDKWARNRLVEPMKTTSDLAKHCLEQAFSSPIYVYESNAVLWCHDVDARNFLQLIQRKWDFKNDCPLPDGVVRDPGQNHWQRRTRLVWKKTGEEYSPP